MAVWVLLLAMTSISGYLAWRMMRLVGKSDAERDLARAALVEANRGLEDEVRARAAELDRALDRLRTLFRLAPVGIAELDAAPGRLRQVLVNLLSNAVKFTEHGEVVVRVARSAHDPRVLRVEVGDTGIGISPERVEQLFHPFTQADSTTTRLYGGTGLGLAISRQLAEVMGGSLSLAANPQQGTTATVAFPAPPVLGDLPTAAIDTGRRADLVDRRVLVVDDNLTNRQILCAWADRHDMECVAVDG